MQIIGKKIIVVGVSASGKSTFSKALSEKTGVPVTFVDSIMWKPGWVYIGDEETAEKLTHVGNQSEWIIEGYITIAARPFLFERADAIIYLNYPPVVAAWRYIKRWWKHRNQPRPELEGCPEKFSFKFLKLILTKGEAISLNKSLLAIENPDKIIMLRSAKETKEFLAAVGNSSLNQ